MNLDRLNCFSYNIGMKLQNSHEYIADGSSLVIKVINIILETPEHYKAKISIADKYGNSFELITYKLLKSRISHWERLNKSF